MTRTPAARREEKRDDNRVANSTRHFLQTSFHAPDPSDTRR
jgi:hypothetical protein